MNLSQMQAMGAVPTEPTDPVDPPITNQHRKDWNDYTAWLAKKGMKGNPELDKGDNFNKAIELYRQENPSTTISKEMIVPIQKEFSRYREFALSEVDKGRARLAKGATKENFMKDLSIVDGMAGSKTTSHEFPQMYLKQFENDRKVAEQKQYATVENSLTKQK